MASSDPNKLFAGQTGFPTPNDPPVDTACRTFQVPADEEYFALLMGALDALRKPYNWYINGSLSQDEAAAAFADILDAAYDQALTGQCAPDVETPYWDDETDVDDDMPAGDQVWYGEVDDPAVAPTALTFRENAEIWTFAGLLAIGGAPGAALSFLTIAPKFVLAFKQGDIGKIIRVFVDADKAAEIPGDGTGDVVEVAIVPPAAGDHQIYLTYGSV